MASMRKRKLDLRSVSSEEFDPFAASTIETFMAMKDAYRVAPGRKIPTPWPFRSSKCSLEASKVFERVESPIEALLNDYNIVPRNVKLHNLYRKGDPETGKDTIIVTTETSEVAVWKEAATLILDLVEKAIRTLRLSFKMRVEIRNPELMYADVSSIIRPDTAIYRAILQIEESILAQVQRNLGNSWQTLSYHMRGRNNLPTWKPTLVITVKQESRHFWLVLEDRIQEAVESFKGLDLDLHVEIIPGLLKPSIDLKKKSIVYPSLPEFPRNGSSIGTRLGEGAGSLGSWVYFQEKGMTEKKKYFLTCHHVIASGANQADRETNDRMGIGIIGTQKRKDIHVDYPAPCDATETREFLKALISKGTGTRADFQALSTIEKYRSAGGIGAVKYSSGVRRSNRNEKLDWALVRLNQPSQVVQNKPPALTQKDLSGGRLVYRYTPEDVVLKYASAVKGECLAKVGRTTEITTGEVNSIDARVNWEGCRWPSREVEVVNLISGQPFAEEGDSGSMVLNLNQEWVGMLIGAGITEDTGYVTPAQVLIDDIEATTGGKISLV